jgi:outer membrane protein OmpA-like peptidoglycan-associated protein
MKKTTFFATAFSVATMALIGCQAGGEFTGREYMPDMAHSIAYETNLNTYYSSNHWGSDTAYNKLVQPRPIVGGTVPRGFTSFLWSGDIDALRAQKEGGWNMNGHVPYYFPATDEGREAAIAAITTNPFPATKSGVAKGKELYDINCAICHGETANGNGYLWRDGEGPYPNKPANLMDPEIAASSEGRYYHVLMRGKGVMGAYADKLSFEERWNVIHYIRSLQNKEYAIADDAPATKPVAAPISTTAPAAAPANFDLGTAEKMMKEHKAANQTLTLNDLKFKTGLADIDLAASKDLDDLVKFMKESATMTIELDGHTDNVGDAAKNLGLSDARAKAVVAYLVKAGIPATRMTSKGFGDKMPIADNTTAEGKAKNRRTDVKIIKE